MSDPFAPSTSGPFFSGTERRILLDEVIHLCQFGNNLVAVLGDAGVGKTAFLSQARYELAESAYCCFITASATMAAEDIFTQVIAQLELPVTPSSSAGEMIATLRRAMAEGQMHRVVVVVDDAHYLSDAILSALASLLQGHQGQHLHILLGGDHSLAQRLDQFGLVDILVYDIALNPFSEAESESYIRFKLTEAGYPDNYWDEQQLHSLWQQSNGYPAELNQAAHTLMASSDMEKQAELNVPDQEELTVDFESIDEDMDDEGEISEPKLPLLHMGLLVVLLAALIMALFYMGGDEPAEESVPLQINLEQAQTEEAAPLSSVEPQQPQQVASSTAEPQPNTPTAESGSLPGPAEPEPVATAETVPLQPSPPQSSPQQAQPAGEQPQVESAEPPPAATTVTSQEAGSTAAATTAASNTPSAPALQQTLESELRKEVQRLENQPQAPRSNGAEATAAVTPASTPVSAPKTLTADEQAVMSWSDNSYALQVIAAGQEPGLQQFIAAQPNRSDLRLIRTLRDNQPWYIVIAGAYEDRDAARRAIQSLPQNQVNAGPWPRKVSDIKQQITTFGRQ